MKIKNLEELDTPCLVLDKTRLEKNCSFAREKCIGLNTILRPHVKTPKSIEVAKIIDFKSLIPHLSKEQLQDLKNILNNLKKTAWVYGDKINPALQEIQSLEAAQSK